MPLSERQTALIHLMRTPHTEMETVIGKILQFITAAPKTEWPDLLETFLYGWNMKNREEPFDTTLHGITEKERKDGEVVLQYLFDTGNLIAPKLMEEGRPAKEVADALASDLALLQREGVVVQRIFLEEVSQVSPYLGNLELPPSGSSDHDFVDMAILDNPRLYALLHKGMVYRNVTSGAELTAIADHLIMSECTTRDERMSVLHMLMYLVAKQGNLDEDSTDDQRFKDMPFDPKTAN